MVKGKGEGAGSRREELGSRRRKDGIGRGCRADGEEERAIQEGVEGVLVQQLFTRHIY